MRVSSSECLRCYWGWGEDAREISENLAAELLSQGNRLDNNSCDRYIFILTNSSGGNKIRKGESVFLIEKGPSMATTI